MRQGTSNNRPSALLPANSRSSRVEKLYLTRRFAFVHWTKFPRLVCSGRSFAGRLASGRFLEVPIILETKAPVEFIDITEHVRGAFAKSEIQNGIVTVFTTHTTTAVKINEHCERLEEDMREFLSKIVPVSNFRHDEDAIDSRPNARGHLMALLLGASETIPVSNGRLVLGEWQTIYFIELDGPRRTRKIVVNVIGI